MKILDLRLKNLNSLAGEWFIDFTQASFAQGGLFAITGATGVGKSTVLDAVCLALYGATPRLEKVNKSFNEIMTKGRAECAAELTFETPAGRWRCHWSQHRSYKRADGELQEPKHEISEVLSGRVLESARTRTLAKVEEITGMNFQQFTRSIMLAQGAFAAFLEARPDQRADLLEQITGADIYTEISKKVHERRDVENKALKELESRLKSLELPLEEDGNLEEERKKAQGRLVELEKVCAEKIGSLSWLKSLAEQEKALTLLVAEELDLARQIKEYEPQGLRLAAAKLAAAFALPYDRLSLLRRDKKAIEADQARRRTELPALDLNLTKAAAEEAEAEKELARARLDETEARPKLTRVRILDHQLEEKAALYRPLSEKLKRLWSSLSGLNLSEAEIAFRDFPAWADLLKAVKTGTGEKARRLKEEQQKLKSLLDHKDLSLWREEARQLGFKVLKLGRLAEALAEAGRLLKEMEESRRGQPELERSLKSLAEQIKLETELAVGLEKKAELIQENLNLQNRLKSLEQLRAKLVPGRPCDLCGSTHHPYSSPQNIPQPDLDEAALRGNKKEQREKQACLNRLREQQSAGLQKLAALEAGLKKSAQDLERLNRGLDREKAALNLEIPAEFETAEKLVGKELAGLKDLAASLENKLSLAEKKEKELAALETALKGLTQKVERADLYLEESLATNKELMKLEAKGRQLREERENLLGRKTPEEEEAALAAALNAADKKLVETKERRLEALNFREKLKISLAEAENRELALDLEIKKAEKSFITELAKSPLADEASFLAARMSEEERSSLEEREKDLARRVAGLSARLEDRRRALADSKALNLTTKSLAELEAEVRNLDEEKKNLQGRLAVIDQKLADRLKAAQRQGELKGRLEKQTLECLRWAKLHELIGSADGKKYRNFAQGLSFEIMISQANRQLARLSDRYLLTRDPAQPLELNVIDNYQAGEIRSTKNLSGGESFLVSLALALGLSQMASRRVRVDSLFLDEGFGTLDEDSLELALDTLAALHGEGKLIGVISHIPAMMNHIGTQIEIRRSGGPHSLISGPGVSRVGD